MIPTDRLFAIGVIPQRPYVYWDYDLDGEPAQDAFDTLKVFALDRAKYGDIHQHYVIRETQKGFHLVMQVWSWDVAQAYLNELWGLTHKQSIMNCRKQRIRISPKWDIRTGTIKSPAPVPVWGCAHRDEWYADIIDRSTGKLEGYFTGSNPKAREWKSSDLEILRT